MALLRFSLIFYICGLSAAVISNEHTIKLSSGYEIPVIGLGTWQIKPEDVDRAILGALDAGYKHIDTAFLYFNEMAIGQSLKKWFDKGGKREDLFITTKLPVTGIRASDVETYLKLSLENLGLDYVDMYLIHAPTGLIKDKNSYKPAINEDGTVALDYNTDHVATWKAMEAQVKAGRTRSIGLSNFNETQILNIVNNAEIKPSNLQVEFYAYNQQKSLRKLCAMHNIAITGFSTLSSLGSSSTIKTNFTKSMPKLLEHPVVKKISETHKKSTAQILLRHALQNGIIIIPKSTNPKRVKENIDIFDFELTEDEMKRMNELDRGEEGRLFHFLVPRGLEKHPQYPWTSEIKNAQYYQSLSQ